MDINLNFTVNEDEFLAVFGMLYGLSRSAHAAAEHKLLAGKLFSQADPKAREFLGNEYEAFMARVEEERLRLDGKQIMVLEKTSRANENN
jgi:hypothetical protein